VASAQRVVAVPVDLALVYDRVRGWHYETAPPAWWFEEQERLLAADAGRDIGAKNLSRDVTPAVRPQERLSLVPPMPVRVTPCRPGSGPCRRRHEHSSSRRSVA
jgi:hypothetical protein